MHDKLKRHAFICMSACVWIWFVFALVLYLQQRSTNVISNIIIECKSSSRFCVEVFSPPEWLFGTAWPFLLWSPLRWCPDVSQHHSSSLCIMCVCVCVCCTAAKSFLAILGVIGLFWSRGLTAGQDMWSDSGFYNFRTSYLIMLFFQFYDWLWHQLFHTNENFVTAALFMPALHQNISGQDKGCN